MLAAAEQPDHPRAVISGSSLTKPGKQSSDRCGVPFPSLAVGTFRLFNSAGDGTK